MERESDYGNDGLDPSENILSFRSSNIKLIKFSYFYIVVLSKTYCNK